MPPFDAASSPALESTAQAELVRSREVEAEEFVRAACERVERFQDTLGAIPVFDPERALEAARTLPARPSGPTDQRLPRR